MRLSLQLFAAVLLALACALPTPARAVEQDPDDEIARRHFKLGTSAYEAHDYPRALVEFEVARKLRPLPELDYDIARCLDRMERVPEAIDAYERFLSRSPPGEAAQARERVALLRERIGMPGLPDAAASGSRRVTVALVTVGLLGAASLVGGAGLLGSTAAQFHSLEGSCAPTCDRASWSGLPARRDAGVALLAIGGVALGAELVLVGLRVRSARRR